LRRLPHAATGTWELLRPHTWQKRDGIGLVNFLTDCFITVAAYDSLMRAKSSFFCNSVRRVVVVRLGRAFVATRLAGLGVGTLAAPMPAARRRQGVGSADPPPARRTAVAVAVAVGGDGCDDGGDGGGGVGVTAGWRPAAAGAAGAGGVVARPSAATPADGRATRATGAARLAAMAAAAPGGALAGGRATVEVISALQSTVRASGDCDAVHEVSDTDDDSGEVVDESVAHPPPTATSES